MGFQPAAGAWLRCEWAERAAAGLGQRADERRGADRPADDVAPFGAELLLDRRSARGPPAPSAPGTAAGTGPRAAPVSISALRAGGRRGAGQLVLQRAQRRRSTGAGPACGTRTTISIGTSWPRFASSQS